MTCLRNIIDDIVEYAGPLNKMFVTIENKLTRKEYYTSNHRHFVSFNIVASLEIVCQFINTDP